jgi:hypothetical protein
MKFFNAVFLVLSFGIINGCVAVQDGTKNLPSSYALKGTSTAVVGIAIDKKGFPLETVGEVVLKPGQKVVFAGPDKFLINFKKGKSPTSSLRYESNNGVVMFTIPRDIFDNKAFVEEYRKEKRLRFDYAIVVNGKELDPPMIITRDE